MNKKDMLRAIGDVDDKFVEEAAFENSSEKKRRGIVLSFTRNWQRIGSGIAAVLAVCVIAGFGLNGAGLAGMQKSSVREESQNFYGQPAPNAPDYAYDYKGSDGNGGYGYDLNGTVYDEPKESPDGISVASVQNVKLIYRANLDLQTTDYEAAEKALYDMLSGYGAYIESSKVSNGSYYQDTYRKNGSYTIRIPSENFEAFLSSAAEMCHVVSLNRSVEDVGETYFELESRINTLRNKEERLQALLKEAKSMSDIIELESALSDVQYQLDRYVGQRNHYDSLISYSTINISLSSVSRITQPEDELTFFQKLSNAFRNGAEDFAERIGDFVIGIGYNIFDIIVILAVLFVIWKFRLISRLWKFIFRKK